jgi:hypothetical protein
MFTPSPNRSSGHVPYVDADAAFQPAVGGNALIRLGEPLLCLHRTLNGIHGARELGEYAVARGVGDPAAVLGDQAVQDLPARREKAKCPDLVRPYQAGIARYIRREDRGELALHSLVRCGHHRQCCDVGLPWVGQRALIALPAGSRKRRACAPITVSSGSRR